jgi:hypothetical protein
MAVTRSTDWRQILAGGGLVAAVGVILLLGAILELPSAPPAPAPAVAHEALTSIDGDAEPGPSFPSEPGPMPAPEPVLDPLSRRTLEDPARLLRSADGFTLQVAVVCRRDNAQRLLDRAGASTSLYVLPLAMNGEECFRLCWGTYPSRAEAARAADLPAELRPSGASPTVRSIREAVP